MGPVPEARLCGQGCYVLILSLESGHIIPVGRLGRRYFAAGQYAYVGSALGGLQARVGRHRRKDKRLHWHIDYLLSVALLERVIWARTSQKLECCIARFFAEDFSSVPRFGASDCRCDSHLFWQQKGGDLFRAAGAALLACGLRPKITTFCVKKSLTCGQDSYSL